MSEKLSISVHILTFNSAETVEKALQSVQNCSDILVIDGGSTDDTVAIAKRYGARVIPQGSEDEQGKPITDFSVVRNAALRETGQSWILSLDSDEYISPELIEEMRAAVSGEPTAYYIPRKYVLADGRIVEHATTYPNERLYFFHRSTVEGWVKPVHERPQLRKGAKTKHFKGASLAPIGSAEEYKERNLRYLAIEAQKSAGKGWGHWFVHRVLHTLRSRLIALVRLILIWIIPHKGTRMPPKQELLRFWYGWKLIVATRPRTSSQ